jgi:hypothetical protein
MSTTQTLVERMLPARFLTQYGVYLQTCAQIEHASWTVYRLADPQAKIAGELDAISLVKAKRSTQELLQKLKTSAKFCHPAIAIRILKIHRRIVEGLESRNSAAHGAFFYDGKTQTLQLEHYFIRKSDPKGTWRHYEEPISQDEIDEALEDADLILRELVSIRSELEASAHEASPGFIRAGPAPPYRTLTAPVGVWRFHRALTV